MNKESRTISDKGQTVVPKSIRTYLNLEKGDRLEWSVNEDGEVVIQPIKKKSVMEFKGVLTAKASIDDMDKVIAESKEEYKMSKRERQD